METFVVVAVLVGALLHAGWNALVKAGGDKELDVALVHGLGAVVCLPLLAYTGLPPRESWPFLATSLCIHVAYYVTLTGAYQHGDLGATYPIMRGSAPMLVALGSSTLLGESLSGPAWLGVCAITLGVMLVGLARPAQALHLHSLALLGLRGRTQLCRLGRAQSPIDIVSVRRAPDDTHPQDALTHIHMVGCGDGA